MRGKASTSIGERSLRITQSYRSFETRPSHWGMYYSKQSQELEVAPMAYPSSLVSCTGEHKATPASCSDTRAWPPDPSVAQLKLLTLARAFACLPALRKEIHFISVNLAVWFRNERPPQLSVDFQRRQNDPHLDYEVMKKEKGLSSVRWKQCINNLAGKVSQPARLSSWKHFQTPAACTLTHWRDSEL